MYEGNPTTNILHQPVHGPTGNVTAENQRRILRNLRKVLLSLLTVEHLYSNYPRLLLALNLLDVVRPSPDIELPLFNDQDYIVRVPFTLLRIEIPQVMGLLCDPVVTFRQTYLKSERPYDESTAKEFSDRFFPRLAEFLASWGFDFHYGLSEL